MRQFKIPKPQKVALLKKVPESNTPVPFEGDYHFADFLAEFVWPAPDWRASAEAADAWFTAQELLENAKPDDLVTFDEATWGFFKPIATLFGKELPQTVSRPLSRLMRPILQARSVTKEELAAQALKPEAAPA